MPFLNNFGPTEAIIIGGVCMVSVVAPIGIVLAVVYWSKRRPPGAAELIAVGVGTGSWSGEIAG